MGDNVLIAVSQELNDQIQDHDLVGRFGGEEFILILKHASLSKAHQISERCRSAIEALVISNDEGQSIHVTASFGIAQSHHGLRPQQVLSQADKALYAAKASGRNQIKCYLEINPGEIKDSAAFGDKHHISPN